MFVLLYQIFETTKDVIANILILNNKNTKLLKV